MSTVTWHPDDYYRALRAARAAWAATDQQLELGLADGPLTPTVHVSLQTAGTGTIGEPASRLSTLPGSGLDPGAEPSRDTGLTANQPVAAASAHLPGDRGRVGATSTTTEAPAETCAGSRGRLQEGL